MYVSYRTSLLTPGVGKATSLRTGKSRDRIPVGGEIFRAILMDPEARLLLFTVCTDSSSGVKRKEGGADLPHYFRDEMRMEMQLHFRLPAYTVSLHWHVRRPT